MKAAYFLGISLLAYSGGYLAYESSLKMFAHLAHIQLDVKENNF